MTQRSPSPIRDLTPGQQLEKVIPDLTPELEDKIARLVKFFEETGIDYGKFKPEHISITDNKKAYPNYDQYMYIPGQHNTQKWLEAVKDLFHKDQEGLNRVQSIRQVTSGWNPMETYDFLNWLRFYQEGSHMKYKMAQLWYESGAPGYFLHVKPDAPKEPESQVSGKDIDFAKQQVVEDSEKRHTIERQRNKIIGRLDSAEKLLRSPDGQVFAGPELEALMEAIYQLKKKIQLVNKVSTSTRLYDDMIIRQANTLSRDGFIKAAEWLCSTAQANNPPPAHLGLAGNIRTLPPTTPPDNPIAPMHPGAPGGLPSMGPGMPQNAPPASVPETGPNENSPTNLQGVVPSPEPTTGVGPASPMPAGIEAFLDNMDTSKITTTEDKGTAEDDLQVEDTIQVMDSEDNLMVTEAQLAPPTDVPMTDKPAPIRRPKPIAGPATETPLEVTEDDIAQPPKGDNMPSPGAVNFDRKVDTIFAGLKVDDVVSKLEDLAKIFKVREVPRQLAIVDMMLDSLGLASYFPSLSEAQNKALESNNYISTRVEDILSKLRGAITTKDIDLKGEEQGPERPEISGVKNKLTQDADKEKQRKQQRKEQEAMELSGKGKETPEVEIKEDLGTQPAIAPLPGPPPAPRPLG